MSSFSLRFLTREGCHLCDDARVRLTPLAAGLGITIVDIDIDSDDQLGGEFGLRIPVLLGPADQVIAEGVFPADGVLRKRLKAFR